MKGVMAKSATDNTPTINPRYARFRLRVRRSRIHRWGVYAYWTLDGGVGGSGAEFVNHSCNPNLATRILKGHILYFSRRRIAKGEELTVDYHFDWDDEHVPCACGADRCRGTINVK